MSIVNIQSSSNSLIPLEVIQLNNTLLNMISSNQEYFLGSNRVYYYAVNDEILLLLENTQLNKQIIDNYAIDFDATRLFSLKFTSRVNGAIEYGIQDVLYALGSSISVNNLDQINALIYSKTNSYIRGTELIGNDFNENEVIVYDSNNKLKTSNILSSDLVRISPIQTITGEKTFTGGVKLNNLNQISSSVSKVLIKNQTTNAIEEADVNAVVNSTSTATPISIESTKFQTYKLTSSNLSEGYVLLPKNAETTISWGLSNVVYTNTGISLTNNQITFSKAGLYTFELELNMVKWGAGSVKDAGAITVYSYINQLLLFTEFKGYHLEADDYDTQRVVFFYNKFDDTQTTFSFRIYHNINNTPVSGEPTGGLLLQKQRTFVNITFKGVETTLGNVLNDTTATNTTLMVKADGTIVKNNNLTPTSIIDTTSNQTITGVKTFQTNGLVLNPITTAGSTNNKLITRHQTTNVLEETNLAVSQLATTDTNQTITGTKTFEADDLRLNPITTAAATTNKFLTRNQTNNAVEETNIAVNQLTTTDTNQTITGTKTFTGSSRVLAQENPGSNARLALTGGGVVSFDSSYNLKWAEDVLIQNIDRSFLTAGYHRITCPTSGTITHYKGDNTTTTVSCSSNGIPMTPFTDWAALYYIITNGMNAVSTNAQFVLADIQNSTFRVNDNWILLAVVNRENNNPVLKWMPGMVLIPSGRVFNTVVGELISFKPTGTRIAENFTINANNGTTILFSTDLSNVSQISFLAANTGISYDSSNGRFTNTSGGTRCYSVNVRVAFPSTASASYKSIFLTSNNSSGNLQAISQVQLNTSTDNSITTNANVILANNDYFNVVFYTSNTTAFNLAVVVVQWTLL